MVEGFLIIANISYGKVTNAERERRQILRTRSFLGEIGAENIAIGIDENNNGIIVTGFLPNGINSLDNVDKVLSQLGATKIIHAQGKRRE